MQVGLDGFHALLSALSTGSKEDGSKEAGEAGSSSGMAAVAATAGLHPKFTAGSLMPLPNNLPRLLQAKGRRGDTK